MLRPTSPVGHPYWLSQAFHRDTDVLDWVEEPASAKKTDPVTNRLVLCFRQFLALRWEICSVSGNEA